MFSRINGDALILFHRPDCWLRSAFNKQQCTHLDNLKGIKNIVKKEKNNPTWMGKGGLTPPSNGNLLLEMKCHTCSPQHRELFALTKQRDPPASFF